MKTFLVTGVFILTLNYAYAQRSQIGMTRGLAISYKDDVIGTCQDEKGKIVEIHEGVVWFTNNNTFQIRLRSNAVFEIRDQNVRRAPEKCFLTKFRTSVVHGKSLDPLTEVSYLIYYVIPKGYKVDRPFFLIPAWDVDRSATGR